MRFALLFLFAIGCNGPKSADAAPPSKETIVQALDRYDALSAKREEAVASKVDGLAETVGNQTSELEALRTTFGTKLDAVEKRLGNIEGLLSVETEISIEVPKAADPPQLSESDSSTKLDAPPAEAADRQTVTFHGTPIDVAEWLSTKLTKETRIGIGEKDTGNRAMVEQHLRYHGLEGDFSRYSREQLITLHSVAHLKDDVKPVKSKTVVRAVVPQATYGGGCANGQCQRPMTYYYSTRSKRR